MRQILELQLGSGEHIFIVGDAGSKENLKICAVHMSPRIFSDSHLWILPGSKILSSEVWSQEKKVTIQNGCKLYYVGFIINGAAQFLQTNAIGVKSAYNNIKVSYGIQENITMIILEVNQTVNRKSALQLSRQVVKEIKQLNSLEKAVRQKINNREIEIMISLINDYKMRKYTNILPEKLIAFVATMIYYCNPAEYQLDINETTKIFNPQQAVEWVLKELRDDMQLYCNWIAGDNGILV